MLYLCGRLAVIVVGDVCIMWADACNSVGDYWWGQSACNTGLLLVWLTLRGR